MTSLRRPVAAILLVTLMPPLSACGVYTTRPVRLADVTPQELLYASGVKTASGVVVTFDPSAPVNVVRDTLHSVVGGQRYQVALADVREVSVGRASVGRSAAATVGWTVAVLATIIAVGCASSRCLTGLP